MIKIIIIGLGGFIGAIMRYWLSDWIHSLSKSPFPYGTLTVNIIGAFVLGVIAGLSEHLPFPAHLKFFLTMGMMGALTTFSTFSYETIMLLEIGHLVKAMLNISISIVSGLLSVLIGLMLGRTFGTQINI